VIGTVLMASPAGSHIGTVAHLWNKHIKPRADKRYVNEGCKAGRLKYAGACYETTNRAATDIYTASTTCAAAGGYLPPNLQLRAAALASTAVTLDAAGEWSSTEFYDDTNTWQGFVVDESGFNDPNADISSFKFRCAYNLGTGVGVQPSARSIAPRPARATRGGATG
jgi:hypothetical protein